MRNALLIIGLLAVLLAGCADQQTVVTKSDKTDATGQTALEFPHKNLTPSESEKLLEAKNGDSDFGLLDIRTPDEFAQGHLSGAQNIDYYATDFRSQINALDKSKTYLIYCRSGNRSGNALRIFDELGFETVYDMGGGIVAYNADCDDMTRSVCMLVN